MASQRHYSPWKHNHKRDDLSQMVLYRPRGQKGMHLYLQGLWHYSAWVHNDNNNQQQQQHQQQL